MQFTAKINRQSRHLSSGQSMVLLRGIQTADEDYRDHCWVELNSHLIKTLSTHKHFKAKSGNGSAIIQFEAEEIEYNYRGIEAKKTLTKIRNIKVIGRA